MLKVEQETLDRMEGMYPGFKEHVYSFENADLPHCSHCGSGDTANVQVGLIGRTINLSCSTTKFKLIANGPKAGRYICNQCKEFFS
jgi:hypothetical protein